MFSSKCCNDGLSQGNSPVIGRDPVVREDLKGVGFEQVDTIREQKSVLKAPATQGDLVYARFTAHMA